MPPEIRTWLFDILQAIAEIDSFFLPGQRTLAAYQNDLKTKRAVERELEIIGEASNRILKFKPDFKLKNIKQIIGTRNRIAHGYDTVSDEMIWSIVINHLPKLRAEVVTLLGE